MQGWKQPGYKMHHCGKNIDEKLLAFLVMKQPAEGCWTEMGSMYFFVLHKEKSSLTLCMFRFFLILSAHEIFSFTNSHPENSGHKIIS